MAKMQKKSLIAFVDEFEVAVQFCEAAKLDYSYLIRNNCFCASLRLSSKGTFLNETFSSISSKCSFMAFSSKTEASSSAVRDFFDFILRKLVDSPPLRFFQRIWYV